MANPPRWLVRPLDRLLSPNRYGPAYRPEYVRPVDLLVLHYTAGYAFGGSARWLANLVKDRDGNTIPSKASAHFVVGRGGEVVQLVPLDERAWHAGGRSSRWRGLPVNSRSIGVEIANLGRLTATEGGSLVDAWGRAFDGPVFRAKDGSAWEAYTDAQLEAVAWLVESLVALFPVLAQEDAAPGDLPRIVGHQDVDPTRKIDPGPGLPLAEIRSHAVGS